MRVLDAGCGVGVGARGRWGVVWGPLLGAPGRQPDPGWVREGRRDGRLERSGARLLGRANDTHKLELGRVFEPLPKSVTVQIASPGTLTAVMFTQGLSLRDDVVGESEALAPLPAPVRAEPRGRGARSPRATWRGSPTLGPRLHR